MPVELRNMVRANDFESVGEVALGPFNGRNNGTISSYHNAAEFPSRTLKQHIAALDPALTFQGRREEVVAIDIAFDEQTRIVGLLTLFGGHGLGAVVEQLAEMFVEQHFQHLLHNKFFYGKLAS